MIAMISVVVWVPWAKLTIVSPMIPIPLAEGYLRYLHINLKTESYLSVWFLGGRRLELQSLLVCLRIPCNKDGCDSGSIAINIEGFTGTIRRALMQFR
jgi:hypothetical protein